MRYSRLYIGIILLLFAYASKAQKKDPGFVQAENNFANPPASARPWVFWYWMNAAVSKKGITADLEAMKQVGIAGAYLMPIKDTTSPPQFLPTARQLTPEWWNLVKFAMQEAKRLNLKLAMHVSDGFALAGGPWITPELSMQKLVWSKIYIKKGQSVNSLLPNPEIKEGYYKDIAVLAYPANSRNAFRDKPLVPTVTTSFNTSADFLADEKNQKETFRGDTICWIQYNYSEPFTCRQIRIHTGGNNYQSHRLIVQASNDGINFITVTRLEPPRHGWQDTDEDVTHGIPATTATHFRFIYNKEGSEPGSEDLDAAKWRPSLRVMGIYLSDEPVINQYESKNGSVWRISRNTIEEQVPDSTAVPLNSIVDLTDRMKSDGQLQWTPPSNSDWVIVRIGHTSTGHTNATGGGGKGLECDKFNAAAIKLQFNNWFGKVFEKVGPGLSKEVLKVFHVDSWECGSQNWSNNFPAEFKKRRGYDLNPYLLAMTGVPLQDASSSEKFLRDVRQTIAELVNDVFYKTLNQLAHAKGCQFSAESVAPTMVSDGMLHYKNTDIPMGEFWLNSPTHDKPNDMLDAISAAHIYGKNIVQAEAFTSVRMNWGEHPGNLKAIGDRNFALGINRMVLHVFTHNPWMDRKPGMTLDGVGLYFQRDQTWFKQSKAWIDYLARCQYLLQMGKPVVDIAVFTGEEVPRRSVLPDRLVSTLPGIFGKDRVEAENKRLANIGEPLRTIPDGVTHSANMADPEDWIDPLNGYAYDSFNEDALNLATVDKNGSINLPGGARYIVLVVPGKTKMQPNGGLMSLAVAKKILFLVDHGASIIISKDYSAASEINGRADSLSLVLKELFSKKYNLRVLLAPYWDSIILKYENPKLGDRKTSNQYQKDVIIENNDHSIAWQHRRSPEEDIYYFSNQKNEPQQVDLIIRGEDYLGDWDYYLHREKRMPEIWYPVTGQIRPLYGWKKEGSNFRCYLDLSAYESAFIIFRKDKPKDQPVNIRTSVWSYKAKIETPWNVQFDTAYGGPVNPVRFDSLRSWTDQEDPRIRYYSGTAIYTSAFALNGRYKYVYLAIDSIYNIATVKINGKIARVFWTPPIDLNITSFVREGKNTIQIEVTNTWANRLIGDNLQPAGKRVTWTTAPFRLSGKTLLPAGLVGNVEISFHR
jgi:hypothetical protein